MTPISTKLTLLVLALPVTVLILSDVIIFYYYKTVDASASIATIAILLLVWERLRDSLSKKLEYLHKNYLLNLYGAFKRDIHQISPKQVKRIIPNLERYGQFMGISLCPENLLRDVDEFLIFQNEFDGGLEKLYETAESYGLSPDKDSRDKRLLRHFTGIQPYEDLGTFEQTIVVSHQKRIQLILEEHPQLIEEIKGLSEKTEIMRKQIFEKLEDFLKSNSLRLAPEPVRHVAV